jgi:NTP pyrophosphatase (non-canonical NTP hydrolase)
MTLSDYQAEMRRTHAPAPGTPTDLCHASHGLGLAGESGEVADLLKKHLLHGVPFDRSALVKELGDVLWYLAAIAEDHGVTLDEVAQTNVAKLRARYPEGFVLGGGVR